MNYTIPPISNQKLTNQKKACIINAKINGGENVLIAQLSPFFDKILVDGEEIQLPTTATSVITSLSEGSHDVQYYIKLWDGYHNEYLEYKGQYILYSGQFAEVPLTHVTIPDNVALIGSAAFTANEAWEQETIEIPDSVKEVSNDSFPGFGGNFIVHTIDNHKFGALVSPTIQNLTFIGTGELEISTSSGSRTTINGNLTFDRQNVTFNGAFSQVNGEEINFGQGNIIFNSSGGGSFRGSSTLKRIIVGDGDFICNSGSGGKFGGNSALETVTFGNGNIQLESGDFGGNSALKKIDFGKKGNLTINGGGTFGGLTSLEEIRFPDGLTTFNQGGNFSSSPLLKSVKIPNLKTAANTGGVIPFAAPTDLEIGSADILGSGNSNNSFSNVKNLTIHRGKIGDNVFAGNPLQSLTLGNVEICNGVFQGTGTNDGYEAKLSNSITKIGIAAFSNAHITKINIPTTLKEIPQSCFQNTWLTEVEIPASVSVIGSGSFSNTPIGKLTLNNGLKRIETYAFNNTKMLDLVIPETVEYIGTYAFCNGTTDYNYYLTNLTINMKKGKIDDYAFYCCGKLRNLKINPGVEELGNEVFTQAYDLIDIRIPGTVKKIGQYCFYQFGYYRNTDYKQITLEEGIECIEANAFYNASINKDLILPNSINYLGSYCLPNLNNSARIITYNPNPPRGGSQSNPIYVPSHLVSKYSAVGHSVYAL